MLIKLTRVKRKETQKKEKRKRKKKTHKSYTKCEARKTKKRRRRRQGGMELVWPRISYRSDNRLGGWRRSTKKCWGLRIARGRDRDLVSGRGKREVIERRNFHCCLPLFKALARSRPTQTFSPWVSLTLRFSTPFFLILIPPLSHQQPQSSA